MKVIGLVFVIFIFFAFSIDRKMSGINVLQNTKDTLSVKAFNVLENKCNECHQRKKPEYVFTTENMVAFAPLINQQVFEKRKMPKGKKNKLTSSEYAILQNWLKSLMK